MAAAAVVTAAAAVVTAFLKPGLRTENPQEAGKEHRSDTSPYPSFEPRYMTKTLPLITALIDLAAALLAFVETFGRFF